MVVKCPRCGKQLRMSAKIQESIRKLGPGKEIKTKCVRCSATISLNSSLLGESSSSLPGVKKKFPVSPVKGVQPPGFPDVSWLKDGVFEGEEVVGDIPLALVLMPDIQERGVVVKAAEGFGYQVEMASLADEAIEKMRFVNYACVLLHSSYEPGGIRAGQFHQYMCNMKMVRRRFIFYVLIGREFKTLYDLQALTYSANVVVNDAEIPHIETVLKKTIPEYEALFGPLMEELRIVGKE